VIRYTKKVRDILYFIEEYNFITAKICANIFYKDSKAGLDQARRKLSDLAKNKDIVRNNKQHGKEYIYQRSKKLVPDHKYYLINLYSEIYKRADYIDYFKIEQVWKENNKKSDGHIIYDMNIDGEKRRRAYLIEFDKYHATDKDKYIKLYESNEVQKWYKNNYGNEYFPDIIQINYNGNPKIQCGEFSVIGLDYDFSDLLQKVIL
jgi:hypothetical protein